MIVTAYKDQHVIVLGLGVTGTATARALKAGGARIGGWDGNPEVQARQCALLAIEPVDPFQLPATVALVVASPGIPSDHVVMQHIRLLSLPITSDIDLAYRTCPTARYVFVTGTNGKSTTVSLLAHMLEENKLQVAAGGNLGPPVLDLPAFDASGVYVLETSSYQLERMTEAVCSVAVWLNITPDHLEYHGSMAAYARAKMNIFHGHPRLSVVGQDDALSRAVTESLLANNNFVLPISVNHEGGIGITLDEHGQLIERLSPDETPEIIGNSENAGWETLLGRHNLMNIGAAWAVARAFRCSPDSLRLAIKTFPGLPHRLERVASVTMTPAPVPADGTSAVGTSAGDTNADHTSVGGGAGVVGTSVGGGAGVVGTSVGTSVGGSGEDIAASNTERTIVFVNDSKATNPEAAAMGLRSLPDIIWLAGGQPKHGASYGLLLPAAKSVIGAVFYGEAAPMLADQFEGHFPIHRCDGFDHAVQAAITMARTLVPQTLVPQTLVPQTLVPQTLVPQTLVPQTLASLTPTPTSSSVVSPALVSPAPVSPAPVSPTPVSPTPREIAILLSPACASYDQFASFAARGERFRALAQAFCAAPSLAPSLAASAEQPSSDATVCDSANKG